MTYRIGKTSKTLREANRHKIVKAIEKNSDITFGELLKKEIVSREPLGRHLRELLKTGIIEKRISETKNRAVYRLTEKGKIPLTIEGMIHYLGVVATNTVFAKQLKFKPELDINYEIEAYANAESEIPAQKFYEYFREKHQLIT